MRRVKSESWLGRVSLVRGGSKRKTERGKSAVVGVLAFEVAGLMSRAAQLWHALADDRIAWLRDELRCLEGVRKLVSDDDDILFELVLAEIMDGVGFLASSVSRLGRRCSDPVLQCFHAAISDLQVEAGADTYGFEYVGWKMERKVKKMERFVALGANLRDELEVLGELEQAQRRILANPQATHLVDEFDRKVAWQRQQVNCLREASLWVRDYDYVVRLLGGSLFSIVGRIRQVFGVQQRKEATKQSGGHIPRLIRSRSVAGFICGPLVDKAGLPPVPVRKQRNSRTNYPARGGGGGGGGGHNPAKNLLLPMMDPRFRWLNAPASTLGDAALALHYANIIIEIEKLAVCPHLIGPDARDVLYKALTTNVKAALRTRLRSYVKNLSSVAHDPILAAKWSAAVRRILECLAPLAHNMIRWQSERGMEQQSVASSSNVLLVQTLYFADQKKTEDAITELLVGLNYLWRYGREMNAKATTECGGKRNLDEFSHFQHDFDSCPEVQFYDHITLHGLA
ncbi:protein PSK SIMULATOR 1-like [Curcuma longa]|uniref:protein PSK SIMULATOR 1-like n=1 Tax=Curcuma longa TaxID=136217 RepID=UPI003D9E3EA1